MCPINYFSRCYIVIIFHPGALAFRISNLKRALRRVHLVCQIIGLCLPLI